MMFHWVNESYGLAGLYLMLSLFGVCLYAILAGGSYLVFFVLRREKHHPSSSPRPERTAQIGAVVALFSFRKRAPHVADRGIDPVRRERGLFLGG